MLKFLIGNNRKKELYNQDTTEDYNEARVLHGNPNGIFNFKETNHEWAANIYIDMLARDWKPQQVDVSKDKDRYPKATEVYKRTYDLVLGQLIANDSMISNHIMDNLNRYITSSIINAALSRHSYEEVNHTYSYTVMAEDIAADTHRIYRLALNDKMLAKKNKFVKDLFEEPFIGKDKRNFIINKIDCKVRKYLAKKFDLHMPTDEEILVVVGSNQVLEELVFPGGFAAMHAMEDVFPGSSSMIAEIQKDETLSHVQLFKDMFRTIVIEEFDGVIPEIVVKRITKMVKVMTEAEIEWTLYATKGLHGFTEKSVRIFVESQANSVCKNLGIPTIYDKVKNNPLKRLLTSHLKGGDKESRSGFFERNVVEYSKDIIEVDF